MSNAATRDDIDEIVGILHEFMKQVDDRFTYTEQRIQKFEKNVNERFNELDRKYDHLITTIDGFISRIDRYETELAARDNQFQRLVEWARKVSEKTGIPLENL